MGAGVTAVIFPNIVLTTRSTKLLVQIVEMFTPKPVQIPIK